MNWEDEGWHQCHFCGEYVNRKGYEDKENTKRHFLSDCRPDLVEHEIGPDCTWSIYMPGIAETHGIKPKKIEETCYAYEDSDRRWTTEHTHFYPDGPM